MQTSNGRNAGLGSLLGLAVFGGVSLVAAAVGARVNLRRKNKAWYRVLRKSSASPPDRVFGLVWPVLYGLGSLSAWRVARTPPSPERTQALRWWATQIAANGAWSPLFFGAHRPGLALADLLGNYAALARYTWVARKVDRPAAAMMLPYLGWLTFAAGLNATVVAKNPRWLATL